MKNHLSKLLVAIVAVILCGYGAAFAQAPTCNQALTPGCLYFPATQFNFQTTTSQTTYTDNAGLQRSIEVAIRIPTGAPIPMPVVIWSHGGATGKTDPLNSMVEWSETTAEAGYLTISIAHTPRTDQERQQLCQSIGINDPGSCLVCRPPPRSLFGILTSGAGLRRFLRHRLQTTDTFLPADCAARTNRDWGRRQRLQDD